HQCALDDEAGERRNRSAEAQALIPPRVLLSLKGDGVQSDPCRWEVPAPCGAEWGIIDGNCSVHHQDDEEIEGGGLRSMGLAACSDSRNAPWVGLDQNPAAVRARVCCELAPRR